MKDIEYLLFSDIKIPYHIVATDRKTSAIEITQDGRVFIRVSKKLSAKQINKFIDDYKIWIYKKYKITIENKKTITNEIKFIDGEEVMFQGKRLIIKTEYNEHENKTSISIEDENLIVRTRELSEESLNNNIIIWYKNMAKNIIYNRANYFAQKMNVSFNRINIKQQKTRWGSCSVKKNLNFNWKLVLMPCEILDYVVVHELAHLKEMNHSSKFWIEVEKIVPNYKELRKKLKSYI